MNKRILVLGYFGYNTNQLDGQTVKTRDIYKLIQQQYHTEFLDYYDTQDFKYKRSSILTMFWKICKCTHLVYLPANNNLKFIFPILFILSFLFRYKIHYYVIGGWLSSYIKRLPIHRIMLKYITGIHVETYQLLQDLETKYGYLNVDKFPNFRFFNFNPERTQSKTLRLVFMARIMKEKGLDWIFGLAQYISESSLSNDIDITFYGQINEADKEYFFSGIDKYDFISYEGVLQPNVIHKTLSQHDVLLLPTHFYTEGLPGSIVDAYISGIPVIVTEWLNSHEFVDEGKSGFIIPFENGQTDLIERIKLLNSNRILLSQMQSYALNKRKEFAPPNLSL